MMAGREEEDVGIRSFPCRPERSPLAIISFLSCSSLLLGESGLSRIISSLRPHQRHHFPNTSIKEEPQKDQDVDPPEQAKC